MSTQICHKFSRFIIGNSRHIDGRLSYLGLPFGRKTLTTASEEKAAPNKNSKDDTTNYTGPSIQELTKEIETLTEEKTVLVDKYKRALADTENTRRIKSIEVEKAKFFAIQGFCKDLIEVADTLNKATECVPKEELSDKNPHLKSLFDGLVLTESILQKVFQKHGLEQINPIDEEFDPNFHEALFQQEVEGKPPNKVVVVSKIGYALNGRCIRPALVAVSKQKST